MISETEAKAIVYEIINKYRMLVAHTPLSWYLRLTHWFYSLDPVICFMADTEEYFMIRDSYDITLKNGIQHDINTCNNYPILKKVYVDMQKEILKSEGIEEYFEVRMKAENRERMARELLR